MVDVVQIPRGVAVVAQTTWAAIKGRDALKVDWDESGAERRGTEDLLADYRPSSPAARPRSRGTTATSSRRSRPAARSSRRCSSSPTSPTRAMEPMNAVAWHHDDVIEVWGGHQMPDLDQAIAAKIAGLPPDKVKLHTMMTGGSFGRRATPDWRRDRRGGRDRQGDRRAGAGQAACGRARTTWRAAATGRSTSTRSRPGSTHTARSRPGSTASSASRSSRGTPFAAVMVKDGIDPTSVEGASNAALRDPEHAGRAAYDRRRRAGAVVALGRQHPHRLRRPRCSWTSWRTPPARTRSSCAARCSRSSRATSRVLELAAEKAGWGKPLRGRAVARGIAVHESFSTLRRPGRRGLARRNGGSRSSASSAPSTAASRSTPTWSRRRWRAASASASRRASTARSRSRTGGCASATSTPTASCGSTRCRRSRSTS